MSNDIYALLAKRIRAERERAGLTREQLAEALDLAPSFLAYLESNQRKPSLPTIVKLAERLRVPVRDLFADMKTRPANADNKAIEQFSHLIRSKTPAQKKAIINSLKSLAKSFEK